MAIEYVIRATGPLGARYYGTSGGWARLPAKARRFTEQSLADKAGKAMNLPVTFAVVKVSAAELTEPASA